MHIVVLVWTQGELLNDMIVSNRVLESRLKVLLMNNILLYQNQQLRGS